MINEHRRQHKHVQRSCVIFYKFRISTGDQKLLLEPEYCVFHLSIPTIAHTHIYLWRCLCIVSPFRLIWEHLNFIIGVRPKNCLHPNWVTESQNSVTSAKAKSVTERPWSLIQQIKICYESRTRQRRTKKQQQKYKLFVCMYMYIAIHTAHVCFKSHRTGISTKTLRCFARGFSELLYQGGQVHAENSFFHLTFMKRPHGFVLL